MALAPLRLRIPYVSKQFPFGLLPPQSMLPTSWDAILWAALTIGRPSTHHVLQHGTSSLYEAMFRIGLIRMALEQFGPGASRIRRTSAFKDLDPTEKGAVSYFLGMAFCKVFASALLDTPWLLHLDAFKPNVTLKNLGRSRPDLVGQHSISGRWLVFETKGRAIKPSRDDQDKAKLQALRVISVAGSAPVLQVGTFSYFNKDTLNFLWIDPAGEAGKQIELPEAGEAWRYYYGPVRSLWRDGPGPVRTEDGHVVVSVPEADLDVYIHSLLAAPLQEQAWEKAQRDMFKNTKLLREAGFQSDGIRIVCGSSWRERVSSLSKEG